jgi:hypothetical protein
LKTKPIYLVAHYYLKPQRGVNTSKAGWQKQEGAIRYDEQVEITRGLKKNADTAKLILDLSNKTVYRNGFTEQPFDVLFKYFYSGYNNYITQIMTQLDAPYFEQMKAELEAEIQAQIDASNAATATVVEDAVVKAE